MDLKQHDTAEQYATLPQHHAATHDEKLIINRQHRNRSTINLLCTKCIKHDANITRRIVR